MSKLYSLLTCINNYHTESKVPSLQGCKNDILNWKSFLEAQFPKERLIIAPPLIDSDATYQNVVHHFGDEFLGRAQAGDTVLFVYSGHGSREGAAPEFDKYYLEGMQETLVLHDSRCPGGLDLADKELAILIERIALKGVNVVVVLDCCHSGSGTRAAEDFTLGAARQHTSREGRRSFESYLDGAFLKKRGGFYLPNSRHILLAACDRKEKAYELTTRQGLFSTCLLQVLEETGGRLSYADLFTRCRIAMSKVSDKQHAQFEPYGFFNSYEGFLGLGGASQGAPLRVFFDKNTWQASMGAVHGLPVTSGNPAQFEVVKDGAVLGLVGTKVVGPESSSLEQPEFNLPPGETYEARLRSLPTPKALYGLQGTEAQITAAKLALETFKPVHFDLLENAPNAAYRLELSGEKIELFRRADGALLRSIKGDDWDAMFQDAFEKLEHIALWETTLALDNKSSKINRSDVELVLVEMDDQGMGLRTTSKNEVVVDILRMDGEEQKVPFRLEVRNKKRDKQRHCALFHASENYAFSPIGFNEPVPGGSTAIAMERNPKGVQYAFELRGKNEETEIFKLFVSNTKLSGEALQQNGFNLGETVSFWRTRGETRGGLRLSNAKGIFGRDDEEEEAEDINDWYTITLRVKCVAKEATVGERALSLAGNFIRILGHPFLRAGVALTSANGGSRSIEPLSVVAELAKAEGLELLAFHANTRDLTPQHILELSDLQNAEGVDENHPLRLEVAANLQESDEVEEMLLPLTFDGEHLLPVGESKRQENGDAHISISHLPDTTDVQRKSLGKALKLCFLKLVLKKKNVQYLRWVDYSSIQPERRSEGLKQEVDKAESILLLLHGIIGDTKGMCDFARSVVKKERDREKPFDLVLSFDYENLNTPIEVTAGRLEELLREEAGISATSGKKITILAHSMGGLVSRYYIQNLKGNQVVKHLVMAGTPNAGSHISKITTYRDYAIPVLTLLVNLPWGLPAAATVLGALQNSKELTVTLAQMDWDNDDWLKNLSKGSLHGVRCSIVAGHLDKYLECNADKRKLMDKVYQLGGKLLYGQKPNDLAVSVESIKAVEGATSVTEVACYHMYYFEEGESVGILTKLLLETA